MQSTFSWSKACSTAATSYTSSSVFANKDVKDKIKSTKYKINQKTRTSLVWRSVCIRQRLLSRPKTPAYARLQATLPSGSATA